MSPALNFRQGGNLSVVVRWTRNDIDLPQGEFTTNLATMRVTYNFTTVRVRAEPDSVQRPDRPLVDEPAVQLAQDGEHRVLLRLQRHGSASTGSARSTARSSSSTHISSTSCDDRG